MTKLIASLTIALALLISAVSPALAATPNQCTNEDSPSWEWRECGNKIRGVGAYYGENSQGQNVRTIALRHADERGGKFDTYTVSVLITEPNEYGAPTVLDSYVLDDISDDETNKARRSAARRYAKGIVKAFEKNL